MNAVVYSNVEGRGILECVPDATYRTRRVAVRTRGIRHGSVTRLMSPADLGQILKPFFSSTCLTSTFRTRDAASLFIPTLDS